jgi:hypothetical protein
MWTHTRGMPSLTSRLLLLAATLGLLVSGCAHTTTRWGHQVTVTEIVLLSQHGVPPDEIIQKLQRSGIVYYLTDEQYVRIREQGVTPIVITAMKQTYESALEKHPRLADDEHFHCFQLGFDGVWYAGGPWGFHPDC